MGAVPYFVGTPIFWRKTTSSTGTEAVATPCDSTNNILDSLNPETMIGTVEGLECYDAVEVKMQNISSLMWLDWRLSCSFQNHRQNGTHSWCSMYTWHFQAETKLK